MNGLLTPVARLAVRLGAPAVPFARHLPRRGPVRARLPDRRQLRLAPGDRVANWVYWRGWAGHEPEAARLWFALAQSSAVVLDVGAFSGYYALLAAFANPASRIVAYEPLLAARQQLQRNLDLNQMSRVEVAASAVGRAPGRAPFYHRQIDDIPTSSGLDRRFVEGKGAGVVADEIDVTSIDAEVDRRSLAGVDLVKIDTETTEHDVLAGAAATLAAYRPAVLCEVLAAGHPEEIDALVRPLGYRSWLLTDAGPMLRPAIVADRVWRNWLLAPPERYPLPPSPGRSK